ncbi:MAG: ATP-binding protein [Syntrophobacteraceae bacterium]|nr:ATP-binding protein [Syntrophobacteraceae bacterium]
MINVDERTGSEGWTLTRKLFLLLLAIFLPASAIIVTLVLEQRAYTIEDALDRARLIVESVTTQQAQACAAIRNMLHTVALLPQVKRRDAVACADLFTQLKQKNAIYCFIALASLDGNILASSTCLHGALPDPRSILDSGMADLSACRCVEIPLSGARRLAWVCPVAGDNSRPVAVLMAGLDTDQYAGFLQKVHLPEGWSFTIRDYRGNRLFRFPEIGPAKKLAPEVLQLISRSPAKCTLKRIGDDGVSRTYAFGRLAVSPNDAPYSYVMVGVAEDKIIRDANHRALLSICVLASLALLAMLFVCTFASRFFIRPINKLVAAADAFGRGDMGARTGLPHSYNEIGRLAKSFDDTASLVERRDLERERAARYLRESEKKYRSIIENAPDAIFAMANGVFTYANIAAATLLAAATPNQLMGRPGLGRVHPSCRDEFLKRLHLIEKSKKPLPVAEYKFIRLDGSVVDVETSPVPFEYDGRLVTMVFVHDMSERRRARKEREDLLRLNLALEVKLQQAQKLESLGTLAGGIAHDFNNILSPIVGYTELCLNDIPQESPVHHYIQQVLKAGLRARDLVKQILAISRADLANEMVPLKIDVIAKEVMKLLRSTLPATIEVRENLQEGQALADASQIHQVMMNLCVNAVQAMEDRGVLDVSLAPVDLSQADILAMSLVGLVPGPHLRLRVCDSGCGMDEGTLERVFDPYFTTKGPGRGTGLGLSVVQGIVRKHKGAVSIRSTVGIGSEFSLYIPEIGQKAESAVDLPIESVSGNECILFVDDEKAIAELGCRLLGRLGYRVVSQTSSASALELFRSDPDRFDLIISDCTMPELTGIDLIGEIHRIRPSIPAILSTGFSERCTPDILERIGAELIMKPFGLSNIAQLMRKLLDDKD